MKISHLFSVNLSVPYKPLKIVIQHINWIAMLTCRKFNFHVANKISMPKIPIAVTAKTYSNNTHPVASIAFKKVPPPPPRVNTINHVTTVLVLFSNKWCTTRKCWLVGNTWRNYRKDFRVPGRNQTHDLCNAGQML